MKASTPADVRVRPRAGILGTAAVTSVVVTSPLFAVLYWLGVPAGTWMIVLAAHVIILLACVVVGLRQLSLFVEVRDGMLRGNGIFTPLEQVELARIARVDLVDTYVGLNPAPVRQLLVRDAEGARLFRMRGNFWSRGALEHVAAALPVAPVSVTEPIDIREFFRRYPGSAYWFENRPAVTIAEVAAGLVVVAALAAGAMLLAGEPLAL